MVAVFADVRTRKRPKARACPILPQIPARQWVRRLLPRGSSCFRGLEKAAFSFAGYPKLSRKGRLAVARWRSAEANPNPINSHGSTQIDTLEDDVELEASSRDEVINVGKPTLKWRSLDAEPRCAASLEDPRWENPLPSKLQLPNCSNMRKARIQDAKGSSPTASCSPRATRIQHQNRPKNKKLSRNPRARRRRPALPNSIHCSRWGRLWKP